MFELLQPHLPDLLKDARDGTLQLPDFQRGWVWEETGIANLLSSVARRFPVGAVLSLKTGGPIRFKPRPIEGAPKAADLKIPAELLLDGQQRITSLYQSLMRDEPVQTRDARGRKRKVHFYLDMAVALEDRPSSDMVVIVDETKTIRENIGRDVKLDLSTPEAEYAAMHFPANRLIQSDQWFFGWLEYWKGDHEKIALFQEFSNRIIDAFKSYSMPLIRLDSATTREAVCLVFEKVNTGGKKLDAFELLTAMFAAESEDAPSAVNLRDDWLGVDGKDGRQKSPGFAKMLWQHDILKGIERADMLRAVSLVHTFGIRNTARQSGRTGKDLPRVSCQHRALLDLPASAWRTWRTPVVDGFRNAARFLNGHGLYWWKDVPYPSQIVALAAFFALRENKPLSAAEAGKIERWFWCGVFGELYGSSTDTKIANDVEDLIAWAQDSGVEPRNVAAADFSESRLDTLRTRNSAAYKGVHALLMKNGARDFLTGERIDVANYWAERFDVHHICPWKWCQDRGIDPAICNSIVNKSPLSARTNRKIGGVAPSLYLSRIEKDIDGGAAGLDAILQSHGIDPATLRADDFEGFFAARKRAMLDLIERAMGKKTLRDGAGNAEDFDDELDADMDALTVESSDTDVF